MNEKNFDKCIAEIRDIVSDQQLVEKTLKLCQKSLKDCEEGDIEVEDTPLNGFECKEIQLLFDKQSLVFAHDVLDYNYIETQIGLYVKDRHDIHFRGIIPIGTYRLITTIDGKVEDDYLVFSETKEGLKKKGAI